MTIRADYFCRHLKSFRLICVEFRLIDGQLLEISWMFSEKKTLYISGVFEYDRFSMMINGRCAGSIDCLLPSNFYFDCLLPNTIQCHQC